MHIGRVAKKIGLTPDAIRFYERQALVPRPPRTTGGFREYSWSDLELLGFIRQAQALGFTLREIGELSELRRSPLRPCAPVRRRLEQKLAHVRRKLADLRKLENELRAALRRCNLGLRRRSAPCPLLAGSSASGREKAT